MPFKNTENMDQIPSESQYKNYISDGLSARRIIYRSVLLINDINEERILTERAPIAVDDGNNVFFRDLIIYLRQQNLLDQGSALFFYDIERQVFVHQGKEPVTASTMIPLRKFSNESIIIKYRPPLLEMRNMNGKTAFATNNYLQREQLFQNKLNPNRVNGLHEQETISGGIPEPYPTQMFEDEEDQQNSEIKAVPREKRVKERKIGYVYDRVQEWRRFYEMGVPSESGKLQKVNLDVAASLVGLSRKTLDDYFKYIRKAEQFNFDFKARSEEKIGVLRNFVRDRQKRTKNMGNYEEVDETNNHEEEVVLGQETTATTQENYIITNKNINNIESCTHIQQNLQQLNHQNQGVQEQENQCFPIQFGEDYIQMGFQDYQQQMNAPITMDMECSQQPMNISEIDAVPLNFLRQRSEIGIVNTIEQQQYDNNQFYFSNTNDDQTSQQLQQYECSNMSMVAHPHFMQDQYSGPTLEEEYDFISNDYHYDQPCNNSQTFERNY